MANRNTGKSLQVIDKTLTIKEQIDQPFDIYGYQRNWLKDEDNGKSFKGEKESPTDRNNFSLEYDINSDTVGINSISGLGLGRACQLKNNKDGFQYPFNISPDAKLVKFSDTEEFKMNEVLLRNILEKVSLGNDATLIIDDVFTQVTTGNWQTILPYKIQFYYICSILDEYPEAMKKVVAFVRGPISTKIIQDGGPDLIYMLAHRYKKERKILDGEGQIIFKLKNPSLSPTDDNKIRIRVHSPMTSARESFYKNLEKFEESHPGYDVYYNTSSKNNGMLDSYTTAIVNGKKVEKPCYFVCFGPITPYDFKNATKSQKEQYTTNGMWCRATHGPIHFMNKVINGVQFNFEEYNYPHNKLDTSHYVSSVISANVADLFERAVKKSLINGFEKQIEGTIEVGTKREINKFLSEEKKEAEKKYSTQRVLTQLPNPNKMTIDDVINEKRNFQRKPSISKKDKQEKETKDKSKQTRLFSEEQEKKVEKKSTKKVENKGDELCK